MLLDNLNVEKLEELTEETEFLLWGIEGNYHYIANRYFSFRVELEEMKDNDDAWDLVDYLKGKFDNKVPQVGQTLCYQHGIVTADKHYVKSLHEKMYVAPKTEGVVTPFLYAIGRFRNRWIDFDKFNVFVNDEFISILYDSVHENAYSNGTLEPLFLCDGDFMILPIDQKNKKITTREFEEFAEIVKLEGLDLCVVDAPDSNE